MLPIEWTDQGEESLRATYYVVVGELTAQLSMQKPQKGGFPKLLARRCRQRPIVLPTQPNCNSAVAPQSPGLVAPI